MYSPIDRSLNQPVDRPSRGGSADADLPLVEVGWLLLGWFDNSQQRVMDAARRQLLERLDGWLPQFQWKIPLLIGDSEDDGTPVAPAELLQAGVDTRNAQHWDYTVVITPADLASHYKPRSVACVSRSL